MGGARRHRDTKWRLTPAGWMFGVVLLVLIVLALVTASQAVYIGLVVVIALMGVLVSSNLPSGQIRGTYRGDPRRIDFGDDAAQRYERRRGVD
jgi:hypothetical protein